MNRLSIRIWFAAALMTVGWLCTVWVRAGYTFEVHPLGRSLTDLPNVIGDFQGTDIPLDERVSRVLNADSVVNRSYRRANGDEISIHMSAWIRPESVSSVAPHVPKLCYTNAGWTIGEERTVKVTTAAGKLPMIVLQLERASTGERCVVAYWYQMGRSTFNTANEARRIHRELWGQKQWPPTVKAMLQTSAHDIDAALPRLERFASEVFQWTKDL